VDVIEVSGLDEKRWDGRRASGDEFEVADGSEEGCTLADSVVPALALLEAEGEKEVGEFVEHLG
jgi:hypothetical protein